MSDGVGTARWIATASAVLAAVLASAAPASAKPSVDSATIEGNAVVGETLTAKVVTTGEPKELKFRWLRCPPVDPYKCTEIDGAEEASYVVADADVGYQLAVLVSAGKETAASEPTAIVTRPPAPAPVPVPQPTTTPAPSPGFDQAKTSQQPAPATTTTTTSAQPTAPYLRPFPVVRIKGRLAPGGAVIAMLRVTAPRRTNVHVRCRGSGCPLRRGYAGVGRLRAFERFLPAGVRITIRAWTPGHVGKHVRIAIRQGKAPARRDACVLPGSTKPAICPDP